MTASPDKIRRTVIAVGLGLFWQVAAVPPALSAKRPSPCAAGRYLVVGDALIAGDAAVPREPIVVDRPRISIGNVCPSIRAKLTATPKGTTVKANWSTCGTQKKVRLRARIDATCQSLRGTLKSKGQPPRPVNAVLSTCGDFIVDPGNVEACEPPGTTTCDAKCRVPLPQTTTSTIASSSTSTTTTTLVTCLTDLGLTVVDGCTGLEWEKKNLQNVANKYSIAGAATWLMQLNAANFAGHADWRLPRMASVGPIATDDPAELETILLAGGAPPRINPIFGPTAAESYWSGSTATPPPPYAPPGVKYPAGIDFGTGFPFFGDLSFAAHVRAVRYAFGVTTSTTTTTSIVVSTTSTMVASSTSMTFATTTTSTSSSTTSTSTSTSASSSSTSMSTSSSTSTSSSSSTSSSTTLPAPASCGNGRLDQPSEQCDGDDDFACIGRCTVKCQCPAASIRVLDCYFARIAPIVHSGPGLVRISDEPVAGEAYPVFLALTTVVKNAVLELVAVAPEELLVATAPLTPCDPDFLPGCLEGSIAIPTDAFTVRVRGEVQGQPSLSGSCARIFSPGPVSIEFRGQESEGFLPGTTSRLVYLVKNPGPSRDFAVSVEDPGGGIAASPDLATLHLEAGATARFSVMVSVPSDIPMYHHFVLRVAVAANDDDALRNTSTLSLLVEGR